MPGMPRRGQGTGFLSRDFRPTHVQCFDPDEDRRLGRNHAADYPGACHPLPPFNQPPPFPGSSHQPNPFLVFRRPLPSQPCPALGLQRPPSLGPPQRCALPQCSSSPSFLPLSPPVQHSDCNDRRRLGRHNAADRLAIAQAAAAAAEAGGATGGEKDRRGSGGGADKPGGSPGRILFGGGAGGGGGGGGSVPSGRRKSRQSSGGGAAAAGGGLQDSLHSPNPSSDSTPGDHADSANRVDRVDQSKPELAIDQRIHPVDHIDQTDPMDTTDDKGAGEVEGEEGEREQNRKSSSGGHHSNNSQDNSNEYDNSEYGWKKSPGAAAGAAAAAVAGSVLPRSSKRVQGSSAKPLKVDLSKLQTSSLRRYKRVYKLRDASSGKEELKLAVAQHFASLVVSEEEIIHSLVEVFSRRYHQRAAANATSEAPAAAAAAAETCS
ncbi:unnamed protein product [Closterium sp. Naga37s-1]|nr:unnamed protein product [Closterium sp. Naga37s-1]